MNHVINNVMSFTIKNKETGEELLTSEITNPIINNCSTNFQRTCNIRLEESKFDIPLDLINTDNTYKIVMDGFINERGLTSYAINKIAICNRIINTTKSKRIKKKQDTIIRTIKNNNKSYEIKKVKYNVTFNKAKFKDSNNIDLYADNNGDMVNVTLSQ